MLEAEGVRSGYHGVTVINDVDLSVGHEIFAILGANGAGKTTLLATLAGLIPLTGGRMSLGGGDVTGLPPWDLAARGLGYAGEGDLPRSDRQGESPRRGDDRVASEG